MYMSKSARIIELEQSLAEASLDVQTLREETESNKKLITQFQQQKLDYEDKAKKLAETHKKELDEVKNLLNDKEDKLNKRLTEALASIGVANFAAEEIISVEGTAPSELYHKFLSLKGAEQTLFYNKHKAEIERFMNQK